MRGFLNFEGSDNREDWIDGFGVFALAPFEFNEELVEKTQDLISIKMQLQTLENNINAQVEELLNVLAVSQLNIQPKFIEIQRNNKELRKIKDYILEANLQSNTFTYK